MPIQDFLEDLGVLPLKAIIFQVLLLLVAIALEGAVFRQHLRLGYKPSMQYAATVNLLAASLGWLIFLALEPLLSAPLRTQIMSYILFGRFYANVVAGQLPIVIVCLGILAFFVTLWVKVKGLEWLMLMLGQPIPKAPAAPPKGLVRADSLQPGPTHKLTLAALEANALSFTALFVLLLLRNVLEMAR